MSANTETIVALLARSIALGHEDRHEAALACLDQAIAAAPDFLPVRIRRGSVLAAMGRHEQAADCYDQVLAVAPELEQVVRWRYDSLIAALKANESTAGAGASLVERATLLQRLERPDEALVCVDEALLIDPDNAQSWMLRGNLLVAGHQAEAALAAYQHVLDIEPDNPVAWFNRGNVLQFDGRIEQALASYRQASELAPGLAEARVEQAHCHLMLGHFTQGWPQLEARWQTAQLRGKDRFATAPPWRGEAGLAGKTILLWAEQGLGDTIQFARYVPKVAALAQRVLLCVPECLQPLLQTLDHSGNLELVPADAVLPPHDWQCPLLSLPLALSASVPGIPAGLPYLRADPGRSARWATELGPRSRPRVGIAWAGLQHTPMHRSRHMNLALLRPLAELDIELFSLQRDVPGADLHTLEQLPIRAFAADRLADFADTAALIDQLDLVISVDTSVAHLAGALGKPVWIMLRRGGEWRWQLDRQDSPWYPSARLFRQRVQGDWAPVVDEIVGHWRRSQCQSGARPVGN